MRLILLSLLAVLAVSVPAGAETLTVGTATRNYELYRPAAQVANGQGMPVMVVLHETGSTGARVRQSFGMDVIARREGFAVAYPDALNGNWNDGRNGVGPRREQAGGDDVAFLRALVQQLSSRGVGTPGDAVVVGIDGGGMMVYRVACDAPGAFSAHVALIANMPTALRERCQAASATRMMILVGTQDSIMPFGGGRLPTTTGIVDPADQTFQFWGQVNRCGAGEVTDLPDLDKSDGTRVERLAAAHCAPRAETVFYRVIGGGHQLPTRPVAPRPVDRGAGKTNHDVDAAELTWMFAAGR